MSFLMSGVNRKWVDNFEHANLSGYYSGATGSFNIQSSTVYEGAFTLESTTEGLITSYAGDGLQNYPSQGDYWKIKLYTGGSSSRPAVAWCAQDNGNANGIEECYYVALDNTNQNLNLWSYDGSNYDRHLRAYYGSDLSGRWLTIYVEHQTDDTHYTELRSADESTTHVSGSGTPAVTSYDSGGVKYWNRGDGNKYFDSFEIVN